MISTYFSKFFSNATILWSYQQEITVCFDSRLALETRAQYHVD